MPGSRSQRECREQRKGRVRPCLTEVGSLSRMRQMEGQEAVFNSNKMGLTIGLLNFIGPVAATSKRCQSF